MRSKWVDLASGVAAAVLIFGAVPAVLVSLVGWPLPSHWDRSAVVSWRGLFDLLAVVAWVAWMACCLPLAQSIVTRVRRRDVATEAGARLTERVSARIAAAVLVVCSVGGSLSVPGTVAAGAMAAGAVPAATRIHPTATLGAFLPGAPNGSAGGAPGRRPPRGPEASPPGHAAALPTYVVRTGDSLWSIAEHLYGDGGDWTSIASVNLDRLMTGGGRFVDPNVIRPGWTLALPEAVDDAAPVALASPAVDPAPDATDADPSHDANPEVRRTTAPGSSNAGDRVARHGTARDRPDPDPSLPAPARRQPSDPLPELAALGIGALGAGLLSRHLQRRARRGVPGRRRATGPEPSASAAASDVDVDVGTALHRFGRASVIDWLEVANRHLTTTLDTDPAPPAIRLLCVGADGVDAWLAEPVDWAPPDWALLEGGRTWRLPVTADRRRLAGEAAGRRPWLPAVVPVGEDARGTWLVVVGPGCRLPVFGADAETMVATMRIAAESLPWASRIVCTSDPTAAEDAVQLDDPADGDATSTRADRPQILFFGDPAALGDGARRECGVVTTLAVPATDLTVVVGAGAASVHPLGVVLRPHAMSPEGLASVRALLRTEATAAEATAAGTMAPGDGAGDPAGGPGDPVPVGQRGAGRPDPTEDPALRPGPIDVRLLTAEPRIDGLSHELVPKRARRATELVAYLALHRPTPVTGDRLRTRVLGSGDADAAAKTLFNVATEARRAMGTDPDGVPFLPPATKTGHYRVSGQVTVDVDRFEALAAAGRRAEGTDYRQDVAGDDRADAGGGGRDAAAGSAAAESEYAMALYRAALDLVEGEPLANALSGYAWWHAEGHAGHLASVVVETAIDLCRLAMASGHLRLAGWALDQARIVEPYSEALSRQAMRLAASSGDTDALRRAWTDCRRRADELEPGCLPSAPTEQLYEALSRDLPAGPTGSADEPTEPQGAAAPERALRATAEPRRQRYG